MKIKAVVYDLDGVLIDMCDNHYKALNKALKEVVDYEIDYDLHIKYYNGISTVSKLDILERRGIVKEEDKKRIWIIKQNSTMDFINDFDEDEDKVEMLQKLKTESYKLVCVSNSIRDSVRAMLTVTGLIEYMDFYLGNEDFGDRIKPDPYPYTLAFEKLELEPEEVMIVEHSPKGIMSATRSGANVFEVGCAVDVTYDSVTNRIKEFEDAKTTS